ncbi:hypothetical protein CAEBREN_01187 [Caenorhabditis brenneri]|uniref:CUB-like domain-containing protein n=1 Tax=Caenorhabditis brenneri TaxID=135651 RepID=G0N5B4_CAEBE|nr:hypothetical protein CAEBREN_01187 [Caenorhabditis brenneri]
MYTSVFIFFVLFSAVYSDANKCSSGDLIQRPNNGYPIYWPALWNENEPAPQLAGNQYCSWYIDIPSGYYAQLIIRAKTGDNSSSFQITDSSGLKYNIDHEKEEPWYFPSGSISISIHTNAPATFALKVSWAQYPATTIAGGIGTSPLIVNITKDAFGAQYNAVTGLSLLAFPADLKNYYSLRSTLVFEGNDYNGRFVSNLYEMYKTHNQWMSNGAYIYVVNVEASNVLNQLLIQEAGYTKDLNPYHELNCAPSSTCSKSIHGGNSKSGFVYVGNQTQTLLDITIDYNATLSVYHGSQNSAGYYKSYAGSTIRSLLPLPFNGKVVQYIVSSGKSMFTFKLSECQSTSIYRPDNGAPVYWPRTWNENQTAPHLAPNQNCYFYLSNTNQKGYYMRLIVRSKSGDSSSKFTITDSSGVVYNISHEKEDPWFFPDQSLTIIVYTSSRSEFAFKVEWNLFPQKTQHNAAIGINPVVVNITNDVYAAEFYSVIGCSLLAFPADVNNYYSLRSTLVYEGQDYNGRYVSTLYDIYKTHTQWMSNAGNIYVINVEARSVLDQLLVQEAGYTVDLKPYQELSCARSSTCSKTLKGGKSKSGLAYAGNQTQTLLDITMDYNATLSVYYGSQNSNGFYRSYNGSTIRSQLPLPFIGKVVQYIVSSGTTMFTFKLSG